MNIRNVSNPAQVLAKEKIEASKSIKSDETAEREGNGQQPHGDGESHRPLSSEEMQKVIEKFKSHEGILKQNLQVVHKFENDQNLVTIETPEGQVIRRFIERDLYFFLYQESKEDLQLFKMTA